MIRKLRIKLIFVAMLSLFLVLAVILSIAGIFSYRRIITDADSILAILQDNDGSFPANESPNDKFFSAGGNPNDGNSFSAELPYESRYFSVFFTEDGSVISVNTGKIAAVDTKTAISYAKTVLSAKALHGFLNDYRYIKYTDGNETHVIFLDFGREMNSFRSFLIICICVSAVGLLAVLFLLLFLSGCIVKPFSENYERQKQFITDAGHELKTPLTIINADAEVLGMDIGENEWLSDIKTQTKRLSQLTNSLIQLSRMDEQPRIEKIEFPISDLVEETANTFQSLVKTHDKTLTCRIQPMLSMNGDEKIIQQLVTILLDNAIKYSDERGHIELSLEKQKNTIRLSVFNTAESVPKESIAHLFDRFYRADPSRNSRTGGYGLGLAIASAIVASHKGKIWASTRDEKSLLITVVFTK